MEKLKKLALIPLLIVGILIFGAWTPYNANEQIRYADAPFISTYATETINFTSRVIAEENYTPNNCPIYRQINGLTNSCGAVAGTMIVSYYDKYFNNLIPGWDSYYSNGSYRLQDTVYVPKVMNELYTLMRTNVDDEGVSESDFVNGLKQYINNQGYNVQLQNLVSGNSFNYNGFKNAIDNGKVIALLTRPGDIYDLKYYSTYDMTETTTIAEPHIMVGYGYIQIKYYNASGLFRTDTYLRVAVGKTANAAYYKVNDQTLTGAYIVSIS